MFTVSFSLFFILYTAVFFSAALIRYIKNRRERRGVLGVCALYCSLSLVWRCTLFSPRLINGEIAPMTVNFRSFCGANVNLRPFQTVLRYLHDPVLFGVNIVGNVLLFLPLGVSLAFVARGGRSLVKTLLPSALVSSLIEIFQLFMPDRTTDTDDLILNCVGALLGYALFKLVSLISLRLRRIGKTLPPRRRN